MKVVINRCWGGFGLSRACFIELFKRGAKIVEKTPFKEAHGGKDWPSDDYVKAPEDGWYGDKKWGGLSESIVSDHGVFAPDGGEPMYCSTNNHDDEHRADPDLLALIEEHGPEWASGNLAELHVVEIPDGTDWSIHDYDGMEHVAEKHETWG